MTSDSEKAFEPILMAPSPTGPGGQARLVPPAGAMLACAVWTSGELASPTAAELNAISSDAPRTSVRCIRIGSSSNSFPATRL